MDALFLILGIIITAIPAIILLVKNQQEKNQLTFKFDQERKNFTEKNGKQEAMISTLKVESETTSNILDGKIKEVEMLTQDLEKRKEIISDHTARIAQLQAVNDAQKEKLENQKKEMEEIGKKFNLEFQNIANRIMEEKSMRFTSQNRDNLQQILEPLGKNIDSFRQKVEEAYNRESKERFSLGKEVQRLMELNQKVSEEANNLASALKGNYKVQGDWGEMILYNILEQSGLQEGREYFSQEYLKDEKGNYLKGEGGGRMRPDAVIQYPDQRKVIIDSKVSLVAYNEYCNADTAQQQEIALTKHMKAIHDHIDRLSSTGYSDGQDSLDFVMMFIPVEPAFLAALQKDSSLWNYAYKKKILLISPTNLVAILKLIDDLWKREYQNQNAIKIAERGAALYDKFTGFVESLQNVGNSIEKAKESYDKAFNQLSSGRGNLVKQAESLKELGVNAKKKLPTQIVDKALGEENK